MLFKFRNKLCGKFCGIIVFGTVVWSCCMYFIRIPVNSNTKKDERYFHNNLNIKELSKTCLMQIININSSEGSSNNTGIISSSEHSNNKNNISRPNNNNNNSNNYTMVETLSKEFVSLDEVVALLLRPWTRNYTNIINFRKRMYGEKYNQANLTESIFASQTSMHPNEKYQTVFFYPRGKGRLSTERHALLPEKSPFKKQFSSCSVVGNGGILVNSSCGKAIDKSEFVFRFNLPPVKKFANDAGSKCNLTTFNPSIVRKKYGGLATNESHINLINSLRQYNQSYFWFPAFHEGGSTRISFKVAEILKKDASLADQLMFGRSDHNIAVRTFWNMTGVTSSGFYMVNTALAMCDDVTLYGFWPFYADRYHRNLQYHYYEPMKLKRKTHHFGEEFRILVNLHKEGLIKMNIDSCV